MKLYNIIRLLLNVAIIGFLFSSYAYSKEALKKKNSSFEQCKELTQKNDDYDLILDAFIQFEEFKSKSFSGNISNNSFNVIVPSYYGAGKDKRSGRPTKSGIKMDPKSHIAAISYNIGNSNTGSMLLGGIVAARNLNPVDESNAGLFVIVDYGTMLMNLNPDNLLKIKTELEDFRIKINEQLINYDGLPSQGNYQNNNDPTKLKLLQLLSDTIVNIAKVDSAICSGEDCINYQILNDFYPQIIDPSTQTFSRRTNGMIYRSYDLSKVSCDSFDCKTDRPMEILEVANSFEYDDINNPPTQKISNRVLCVDAYSKNPSDFANDIQKRKLQRNK